MKKTIQIAYLRRKIRQTEEALNLWRISNQSHHTPEQKEIGVKLYESALERLQAELHELYFQTKLQTETLSMD